MSWNRSKATEPMRKCIGCMESKPKRELMRIAYKDEQLTIDPSGKAPGRGVYLCRNAACVAQAQKKNAFSRSFRRKFAPEMVNPIFEELSDVE